MNEEKINKINLGSDSGVVIAAMACALVYIFDNKEPFLNNLVTWAIYSFIYLLIIMGCIVVIRRALAEQDLPIIRMHDLRHSHASMMIELGCNILLVAERLGDTPGTALDTYSHLYPNKQEEFVSMIE